MTVENQNTSVIFTGNGVSTQFSYTFRIPEITMVDIALLDATTNAVIQVLAPGSYTITGVSQDNYNGGMVTYPLTGDPLSSDYKIYIGRTVEYTQGLDLVNQGGFYPESIEYQLDKVIFQIQQLKAGLDRSYKTNLGIVAGTFETLPADHLIISDGAGNFVDGGVKGGAANIDPSAFATAAQGQTADSAVQPGTVEAVPTDGTLGQILTKTLGGRAWQSHVPGIGDMIASAYDPDNKGTAVVFVEDEDTTNFGFVLDEDDMASNSATKTVTQQSVKAYVDGPGIQYIASGDTTGAADLAALDALIGVRKKIILIPGATYYLASKWTIDSAVDLYLNGATIQAKAGFTDGQLICGTASGIRIHGPGKIDGTNLPNITADFIGTVFTGITVFIAQNQSTPLSSTDLTGIVIDDSVEILSGSCGALAAYSCPSLSVRATADGSALNATYQGAALFFIVKCDNSNTDLRIKNRKWKGVSYSSCNGGISNAIVENSASAPSGFAGVHATSSSCMVMDASIKGGFGFKTDSCLDIEATVVVDCNSTGLGGVVLQGGNRNKVRGVVKNFTGYGCAIANDATGNAIDHDVDLIMFCATSPGDGSLVGYSLSGGSGMGIAGLKLSGVINTVDIAVKSADADTTPVMGNIDITALRLYNIKNYLGYGPFGSLHVNGGSAIDCSGLTDGWRLWSGLSGKEITFDGFVMRNCGTAANLLTLDTTVGAIQLNRVSINGGGADGSGGLMKLNIASASYYVKSLSLTAFDGTNLSLANAASLTSLSTTVIALNVHANKLLSTDYSTRRAINLSATAKFKGLCAETNNLATVPTAPTAP